MFYWSNSKRVVTNIVLTSPLCCVNSERTVLLYKLPGRGDFIMFIHWCIVCYFNHHDLQCIFAVGQNINP